MVTEQSLRNDPAERETPQVPVAPSIRGVSRFSKVIITLLVVAILGMLAYIWLIPHHDWEQIAYNSLTFFSLFGFLILLLAWYVLLGPSHFVRRLGVGLIGFLVLFTLYSSIHEFTGDMMPVFGLPWDKKPGQGSNAVPLTANVDSLAPIDVTISPTDLPSYRGEQTAGEVSGPPLSRDWTKEPPELLWKHPCGGGYSSFAIAGNVAVTMEQRGENEAVVFYDRTTGTPMWIHAYPALFQEPLGGPGPRATPTIADGKVFALGATGTLLCLDPVKRAVCWETNILADASAKNLDWAMSGSPLAYGNLLIVNPGGKENQSLVAYDRETGKRQWAGGSRQAGYSSPMVAELAGTTQILIYHGEGLSGHDPKDGRELWMTPWKAGPGINVAQPLLFPGDRVFVTSGYSVGGIMVNVSRQADHWQVKTLYETKGMRCRFTSPVSKDGYIYGLDDGIMTCISAETGKRTWKSGRFGNGQILLQDDLIVIQAESGDIALMEANPTKGIELGRIKALGDVAKTWNCPALADGRLFVRNHAEMACFDLRARRSPSVVTNNTEGAK